MSTFSLLTYSNHLIGCRGLRSVCGAGPSVLKSALPKGNGTQETRELFCVVLSLSTFVGDDKSRCEYVRGLSLERQ